MKFLRSHIFQSQTTFWIVSVVSLALYSASIALVHWDTSFTCRWVAFWMHSVALSLIVGMYMVQHIKKSSVRKMLSYSELVPFLVIVLVTEVANFLYLGSYQFVSFADELRDGGLFALKIANGSIKNIFAYGSYEAHGLIIPVISRFFYAIFGSNVLTYRVPSAILASLGVFILYILVRRTLGRTTAFWTCLVLVTMPLQMFFAHSQIVIGFNLFFIPLLLTSYQMLLKKHGYREYVLMGCLLGFSAGFHASLRAFSCLILLMILCEDTYKAFNRWPLKRHKIVDWIGKCLVIGVFAFVGFGPRVLFTSPSVFFHTSRLPSEYKLEGRHVITQTRFEEVKNKYMKSLMVYVYEPTVFFYPGDKPLFPPFIALLFILGVGYSFFLLKNPFVHRLLIILGILPLFISAITDVINADHRVSVLFAIASVFVGIGIAYALASTKNGILRYLLGILLAGTLIWQASMYYIDQPANKRYDVKSYIHMHAMMKLQGMPKGKYCLRVSPSNYEYYTADWGHDEQVEYFLPGFQITYVGDESLQENELFILKNSCLTGYEKHPQYKHLKIDCSKPYSFECPVNFKGEMWMYYE